MKFKSKIMPLIHKNKFEEISLKSVFPLLDIENIFTQFIHLGFQYDPRDYYIIPYLYRDEDDGYLTPVFFDKDLLLYYNSHPDYSVRFSSFSSCNIYYKSERLFNWGFGINRAGKLFKWLGDLDEDFEDEGMKSHLKRFQASNIPSDHDVVSKFYFSQNPTSTSDIFQKSDNEARLFYLNNQLNDEMKKEFGLELTKVQINQLQEYYRSPIMEEREQVFSAFLSLNKYLIENLQEQSIRNILIKFGLKGDDLQKDGKKLGSLKLFSLFIMHVLQKGNADEIIAPLFVLNDLRQLHGHLSETSFEKKYNFCKERLGLSHKTTDLEVFKALILKLNFLYESLVREGK